MLMQSLTLKYSVYMKRYAISQSHNARRTLSNVGCYYDLITAHPVGHDIPKVRLTRSRLSLRQPGAGRGDQVWHVVKGVQHRDCKHARNSVEKDKKGVVRGVFFFFFKQKTAYEITR